MDFIIALNRPALLEARQRAEGVLRGGMRGLPNSLITFNFAIFVPNAKGWFLTVRKNPAYSVLSGIKEMVEAAGIEPAS